MILLDNIIFDIQSKGGGVTNVWKAILEAVMSDDEGLYTFLSPTIGPIVNNENIHTTIDIQIPLFIRRFLDISIMDCDLLHSSYYRTHSNEKVINVVTIHDFIYEKFDNRAQKIFHLIQKKRALNKADAIICVSKNTKSDLIKYYPEISHDKISVIYNGVDNNVFFPKYKNPESIFSNFILTVGGRNIHKNFDYTLNLMTLPIIKEMELNLIVVGGGDFTKYEREFITKNDLWHRIIKKGFIGNDELNTLYNNALALVYPSIYEGFGIPPIEAMSAGCPVILSELSSLPEVASHCGLYIDHKSPESAVKHLLKVMDIEERKKIINSGFEQAKKFSWKKTGVQTLKLYKKLLSNQ